MFIDSLDVVIWIFGYFFSLHCLIIFYFATIRLNFFQISASFSILKHQNHCHHHLNDIHEYDVAIYLSFSLRIDLIDEKANWLVAVCFTKENQWILKWITSSSFSISCISWWRWTFSSSSFFSNVKIKNQTL